MGETTIEQLDAQIEKLKERRRILAAKKERRRRRIDTRCKILVGAHLRKLADAGDAAATAVYRRVIAELREDERSREALDEWGNAGKSDGETDAEGEKPDVR